MKKAKKLLATLFGVFMLVSCMTTSVFAAETGTQDGLNAVIQTDKEIYAANEDIQITVTVTNTNTFEVKNVSIESLLPDALTLKDGDLKSKTVDLKPGETLSISCVAVLEKDEPTTILPTTTEPETELPATTEPVTTQPEETTTEETTTEMTTAEPSTVPDTTIPETPSTTEQTETTTGSGAILPVEPSTAEPTTGIIEGELTTVENTPDNPDTGSGATIVKVLLIALAAAAVVAAIILITRKNSKKATKVISLVLCGAIAVSSFATVGFIKVGAEEGMQLSFSVDKMITVDNEEYIIQANMNYDKSEEEQTTWYQGIDEEHVVNSEKDGSGFDYINNRIIVLFELEATKEQKEAVLAASKGTILGVNDSETEYQIEIKETQNLSELRKICDEISSMPGVAICYKEKLYELNMVPNDPWKDVFEGVLGTDWDEKNPDGLNWWLETIQAPSAWDYNERFSNIKIGIVDNGFDTNHEDLELSVVNPNHNEMDTSPDHGTHVAGVIGATPNNDVGITGIVWNKELYCADVISTKNQTENQVSILSTYDGIKELLKKGCKVINQSIGCVCNSTEEIINEGETAVSHIIEWKKELNSDFIVVQSAGNDGIDSVRNGSFSSITDASIDAYFSKHPDDVQKYTKSDIYQCFMIVGAIEQDGDSYKLCDAVSGFLEPSEYNSNYGEGVSIVAPGLDIYSCSVMGGLNGNYVSMSGTSMAAPIVTGVASLVWSVNPDFTAGEVKDIVCTSTNKTASSSNKNDSRESYPIVNAKLAVEEAIRRTDNTLTHAFGTVIDAESGLPLEATVEVSRLGETIERKTNPQDGSFSFELEPGEYTIRITSPGYQFIYTTFNVPSGTDYQFLGEFNMTRLSEQTPRIGGYVKDKETDQYLSGVTVTAYDENRTQIVGTAVTDNNGSYEVAIEKLGTYDLVFNKDGYSEYVLDNVHAEYNGLNGVNPVYLTSSSRPQIDSGTCGDNLTWVLYEDGELVISGTGRMWDNSNIYVTPWHWKKYSDKITQVIIDGEITYIGELAFQSCSNLKAITIPDNVTSIGYAAFRACTGLVSINIGSGFRSNKSALPSIFDGCTNLKEIKVSNNNSYYSSLDGVLFDKNKTEIILYPRMKESIMYTIPETVISIGAEAFSGCENLYQIEMSNNVKNIGHAAFSSCTNLSDVNISNNVSIIPTSAFCDCLNLKSIVIPSSIIKIDEYAFSDCTNLSTITILNADCAIINPPPYNDSKTIEISTTICGYKNSTAEVYAKENGNHFVPLD